MASFSPTDKDLRQYLLNQFLATGRAPAIDDIAEELSLTRGQVLESCRHLEGGICAIMHESQIYHFPPFANYQSAYPVTVDGQQKWFAECGMEVMGLSFVFPGKEVAVNTTCALSGEPIEIRQKDGKLLGQNPTTTRLHVGLPLRKWPTDPLGTCRNMKLFASEAAIRDYVAANPQRPGYPLTLQQALGVMTLHAQHRLQYEYVCPFTKLLLKRRKYGLKGTFWWPNPLTAAKFVMEKGKYWR